MQEKRETTTSFLRLSTHDLYLKHALTPSIVDTEAGVVAGTTYNMIQWIPVKKEDAAKVLALLGKKYQQDYTLDTVQVKLSEEGN
jgi:hypothetical protein